jgi:hypothetical protein
MSTSTRGARQAIAWPAAAAGRAAGFRKRALTSARAKQHRRQVDGDLVDQVELERLRDDARPGQRDGLAWPWFTLLTEAAGGPDGGPRPEN